MTDEEAVLNCDHGVLVLAKDAAVILLDVTKALDASVIRGAGLLGFGYVGALALQGRTLLVGPSGNDPDSLVLLGAAIPQFGEFVARKMSGVSGDGVAWLHKLHALTDTRAEC